MDDSVESHCSAGRESRPEAWVVDLREAFHAFVILNTRCFHLVHELCLKVSYLLP